MAFSIVIDGHNFINDLNRHGKEKDYVLNKLSFPFLQTVVQRRLTSEGLYGHPFIRTEFICSDKGEIGPFKGDERKQLLKKLQNEKGVTVLEVSHHTKKQKGVDLTVFIRMMTLAQSRQQPHAIVLFSSDTDFVPAIRLIAEQGIHVVIVGFKTDPNPLNGDLINESYLSLDLGELLEQMENLSDNQSNSGDAKNRSAD
jgi:uncharacterized LabA/DUF88 family protein